MAVLSTTATSDSSDDSNVNSLAVEGKVSAMVDVMPDASSMGRNYFRLKERALMRPKRDARKTIQGLGFLSP